MQRRGGPVEVIRPGDRVRIEPDEEHWHGATPDRLMVHLALNEVDDEDPAAHWASTSPTPSITPTTDPDPTPNQRHETHAGSFDAGPAVRRGTVRNGCGA